MPKALVTGSSGFVGRHIIDALDARGYQIDECDIKNGSDARDLFRSSDERYDLIVHAAYLVGGRESIDGLNLNLATNISLDGEAFNYALRSRAGRLLYFSSSAAYPIRLQRGDIPHSLRESDIVLNLTADQSAGARDATPDAHYGWGKITGEKMAVQARKMGLNVHVVRPFSGYGEDQGMEYPFPSIVERALAGDYTVWGPKEQTRDWIHIDDIIDACMRIIETNYQKPVNLCTGRATTMGELLAKAVRQAYGIQLKESDIFFDEKKPTGVTHRVGNPDRMFSEVYRPRISLAEGIRRALAL